MGALPRGQSTLSPSIGEASAGSVLPRFQTRFLSPECEIWGSRASRKHPGRPPQQYAGQTQGHSAEQGLEGRDRGEGPSLAPRSNSSRAAHRA